jgi:hypothetical protein
MNCKTVLVGGNIAFEANKHRALPVAEYGLGSATCVERIGVDTNANCKVHGHQGAV